MPRHCVLDTTGTTDTFYEGEKNQKKETKTSRKNKKEKSGVSFVGCGERCGKHTAVR